MHSTEPVGWGVRETIPCSDGGDVRQIQSLEREVSGQHRQYGRKLGDGKVVASEGSTDRPFVEAKEVVGGFMIIEAESMEQAIEVARESPGVAMPGSSVEVREISTP